MGGGVCRVPKCIGIVLIWFLWVSSQTRARSEKTKENCWDREEQCKTPAFQQHFQGHMQLGLCPLSVRFWHVQDLSSLWSCSPSADNDTESQCHFQGPPDPLTWARWQPLGFVPLPHQWHGFCHSLCPCRGVLWLCWDPGEMLLSLKCPQMQLLMSQISPATRAQAWASISSSV